MRPSAPPFADPPPLSFHTHPPTRCRALYQTTASGTQVFYDSVNKCGDPERMGWVRDAVVQAQQVRARQLGVVALRGRAAGKKGKERGSGGHAHACLIDRWVG